MDLLPLAVGTVVYLLILVSPHVDLGEWWRSVQKSRQVK